MKVMPQYFQVWNEGKKGMHNVLLISTWGSTDRLCNNIWRRLLFSEVLGELGRIEVIRVLK